MGELCCTEFYHTTTLLSSHVYSQPNEALAMLPPYQTGRLDNSPKMVVAMEILDRSVQMGDKLLIFRYNPQLTPEMKGLTRFIPTVSPSWLCHTSRACWCDVPFPFPIPPGPRARCSTPVPCGARMSTFAVSLKNNLALCNDIKVYMYTYNGRLKQAGKHC